MDDQPDEPTRPDQTTPPDEPADAPASTTTRRAPRPTRWVLLAVGVAVLVVGVGVAIVVAGDDDGEDADDARTGDDRDAGEPSSDPGTEPSTDPGTGATQPGSPADAVVAVTYEAAQMGDPVDLTLRFLGAGGTEIASRSWSEVEDAGRGAPSEVPAGGLLQALPAGETSLEATLRQTDGPTSCTQPFTVASGDQLILRLEEGPLSGRSFLSRAQVDCARVEPVSEWVEGQTGPTGESYVGLGLADAEARAQAAGLTTRVVAVDGTSLAITLDLRPDRLNLMVFDGTVVAARLDDESSAGGPVPAS